MKLGRTIAAGAMGLLLAAAPVARGEEPTRQELLTAILAERDAASTQARRARLPVRLRFQLTAEQEAPVYTVLSGGAEGDEDFRYTMTHPLFSFEWRDGGLLLVDPGYDPEKATSWTGLGKSLRVLLAKPICVDPDSWDELAKRHADIRNVVFSHLHVDHVSGLSRLCQAESALPVLLTSAQRESDGRYEQQELEFLQALQEIECAALSTFEAPERVVQEIPGSPGTFLVPVGGHTPGSQLVVGFVNGPDGVRSYAIAGDVVNHRNGFAGDGRPKPWWYRTFLIPEDEARQVELRRLLADLEREGFAVLVNHDLVPSLDGLEPWSGSGRCEAD